MHTHIYTHTNTRTGDPKKCKSLSESIQEDCTYMNFLCR